MRLEPHTSHWPMPSAQVGPQGVSANRPGRSQAKLGGQSLGGAKRSSFAKGGVSAQRLLAWSLAAPKADEPSEGSSPALPDVPEEAGMCWVQGRR